MASTRWQGTAPASVPARGPSSNGAQGEHHGLSRGSLVVSGQAEHPHGVTAALGSWLSGRKTGKGAKPGRGRAL